MTTTNTPAPDAGHATEPDQQMNLLVNLVLAIEANARALEVDYGMRQRFDTWTLAQELDQLRKHTAPARTAGTETGTPITDEPWRILSEWIGSGLEAHAAMAELAEAGFVIVSRRLAQYAKFDPKALHREGLFDDALALQSVLAARQGEGQPNDRSGPLRTL